MTKLLAIALLALAGCTCEVPKEQERMLKAYMDKEAAAQTQAVQTPQPETPLAVSPCKRARPYKNWSNEELSAAMVEYMGTPQSQGLINEGACRQAGR